VIRSLRHLEAQLIVVRFRILLQKILLTALSGFVIWRSALLVSWLVEQPHPASIGTVLIQSIRLNFYIINIFVICLAWPVHRLFPDSYYEAVCSKSFASACTILRIEQFRKLLRRTIWSARNSKRFFFDGTRREFSPIRQEHKESGIHTHNGFCNHRSGIFVPRNVCRPFVGGRSGSCWCGLQFLSNHAPALQPVETAGGEKVNGASHPPNNSASASRRCAAQLSPQRKIPDEK
jgi:hypothetical protein